MVDVVLRFEQVLGRRVLVVGPTPQPVAHIDMIVTPVGDGRLVVADAKSGIRMAEEALSADPDSVSAFESYCEQHFFGHPSLRELPIKSCGTSVAPKVVGRTQEMVELSRALSPLLDGIAQSLEGAGYQFDRVPSSSAGPRARMFTIPRKQPTEQLIRC